MASFILLRLIKILFLKIKEPVINSLRESNKNTVNCI